MNKNNKNVEKILIKDVVETISKQSDSTTEVPPEKLEEYNNLKESIKLYTTE